MAKKKAVSSSRKSGNAKTKSKRTALDNSTSEEALQRAIDRQRQAIEDGEVENPYASNDPDDLVETLLDVPNRKPLADPGPDEIKETDKLVRLVHDKPSLYKKFVMQMREGTTLASAVFSSRIASLAMVKKWLGQGMADSNEDKDTFYSRFYYDTAGAHAEKRAEVEILVAEDDPKFWLQHGPGKYLDDEWKPKAPLRGLPNGVSPEAIQIEGENTLRITQKVEVTEGEIEGEILEAPVDDNQYRLALEALKAAGVSPSQQSEGWMKALKIQSGEQLSEEELEVKEDDDSPISLGSNEALLTEQDRQAQSSYPY